MAKNLHNLQEACDYVNAASASGQGEWLRSLGDVAKVRGMSTIARGLGINRSVLYHMLSRKGNPLFRKLLPVFPALQMRLKVVPIKGSVEVVPMKEGADEQRDQAVRGDSQPLADL